MGDTPVDRARRALARIREWGNVMYFLGIAGMGAFFLLGLLLGGGDEGNLNGATLIWWAAGVGVLLNCLFWAAICRALEALLERSGDQP